MGYFWRNLKSCWAANGRKLRHIPKAASLRLRSEWAISPANHTSCVVRAAYTELTRSACTVLWLRAVVRSYGTVRCSEQNTAKIWVCGTVVWVRDSCSERRLSSIISRQIRTHCFSSVIVSQMTFEIILSNIPVIFLLFTQWKYEILATISDKYFLFWT